MKFPVGYGGITKLKGKRTKPYMAYVSEMVTEGVVIPPTTKKSLETKLSALQEASTVEEVNSILRFTKRIVLCIWNEHNRVQK